MSKLIDDPRLTAYALGELSQEQREEFEMEMKKETQENQELLNKEVEVIKEQSQILETQMQEDPMRLSPEQVEEIAKETYEKEGKGWLKWMIGISATAFPLLVVTLMVVPKHGDKIANFSKQEKSVLNQVSGKTSEKLDLLSDEVAFEQKESEAMPSPAVAQRKGAPRAKLSASKKLSRQAIGSGRADSFGGMPATEMSFMPPMPSTPVTANTESYEGMKPNEFVSVASEPLSTFSVDVDTASYANARRFLNNGQLPPSDSIRVEEFINYFDYNYKAPLKDSKTPFATHLEMAQSPYNSKYQLVKIGIKGKEMIASEAPLSNIVFLMDVSGSMSNHNKLPLVKDALKLLTRKLTSRDKISIVVYAGASGLVLPPTPGNDKATIMNALTKLQAGGSTNGGAGIELAYKTAKENFIKGGNNRVILVTDGDFNLGTTSRTALVDMIEQKAKSDIFLTVLGVGMGNYKDSTLEQLADKGNGNYAYLDNLSEAKKVLIQDRFKTLHTIAKDVKIQVEFNPSKVQAYRLIGYENRKLNKEDFNDDTKDAGEIGAGHTVTALYEIVPQGVAMPTASVDKLRYQKVADKKKTVSTKTTGDSDEVLFVKIRYKEPTGTTSKKLEFPLKESDRSFQQASNDFRFASAVAGYAMILRKDKHVGDMSIKKILETAKQSKGSDEFGLKTEFIENVELSRQLYKNQNQ